MKAPIGAVVSIYYDSPRDVQEGDALQTPSGRLYLLLEVRRQVRGIHIGRWHLKALVSADVPEGTQIHPIYWYPRGRRQNRLKAIVQNARNMNKEAPRAPIIEK